jgi:hypothetical protein
MRASTSPGTGTPIIWMTSSSSTGKGARALEVQDLRRARQANVGDDAAGDSLVDQPVALGCGPGVVVGFDQVEVVGDVGQPALIGLDDRLPADVLGAGAHRRVDEPHVARGNCLAVAATGLIVVAAGSGAQVAGEVPTD